MNLWNSGKIKEICGQNIKCRNFWCSIEWYCKIFGLGEFLVLKFHRCSHQICRKRYANSLISLINLPGNVGFNECGFYSKIKIYDFLIVISSKYVSGFGIILYFNCSGTTSIRCMYFQSRAAIIQILNLWSSIKKGPMCQTSAQPLKRPSI